MYMNSDFSFFLRVPCGLPPVDHLNMNMNTNPSTHY